MNNKWFEIIILSLGFIAIALIIILSIVTWGECTLMFPSNCPNGLLHTHTEIIVITVIAP